MNDDPLDNLNDDLPSMGHNSEKAAQLRDFVARIEKLMEEKDDINEDIRSIYAEGKRAGFDTKVMRAVISERRKREKDPEAYSIFSEALELYKHAMGMLNE